jgi:hypothetical protein
LKKLKKMNLGNFDPKKIGGKVTSDNGPEFLDSISSSISANNFLPGMVHPKGIGSTGLILTSGQPKSDLVDLKPVALASIFHSVKKGVQTGVTAAVKAGRKLNLLKTLKKFTFVLTEA